MLDIHHIKNAVAKSLFIGLVGFLTCGYAFAADITLTPTSGTFKPGKTFTVDVYVSNNTQTINAVSASVTFPADTLQVNSISKDGSIIKMWAEEPSFSNTNGTVKLEGVILNPGFSSTRGKVLSISFTAKKAGTAAVVVASGSVLANDGNASNVTGTLGSASYEIQTPSDTPVAEEPVIVQVTGKETPQIRSSTHPSQDAWYTSREASFEWTLPKSVTAVRTLYDDKAVSSPSKVYDPAINNRSFIADSDGVLYMHVQFKNASGWGDISHYKFAIDSKAPDTPSVTIPGGTTTSDPQPLVSVVSNDTLSGIDHITLSLSGREPVSYSIVQNNLYKTPRLSPGKNTVTITVFDKAGNSSKTDIDLTLLHIDPPTVTDYTKYVEEGGIVRVSGTTYPRSTVEVTLVDRTNKQVVFTATSNDDGEYTASSDDTIKSGIYEMKPRVTDQKGTVSDFGEVKVVVIEKVTLIRIGMFVMNWLSVILIVIIASVSVAATLWFSLVQFRRLRKRVKRTMEEAENTLKVNVQALRRDTEEFRTVLVKAQKKRELTKEETAMLKKFEKRLEIVEHEIEKKLEAIQ